MNVTQTTSANGIQLTIEGELTIYEVADLRMRLLESFSENQPIELDLTRVEECDASGVQLLCSAKLTAEQTGKNYTVSSTSDAVINAIEGIGLNPSEVLGI